MVRQSLAQATSPSLHHSPRRLTTDAAAQPTPPSCAHPHPSSRLPRSSAPSICDLQEKFRPAIHEFPRVIATAQKLLAASHVLDIPVFATTQNRARLGETCPELRLDAPDGVQTRCHLDKTLFSMMYRPCRLPPCTRPAADCTQHPRSQAVPRRPPGPWAPLVHHCRHREPHLRHTDVY